MGLAGLSCPKVNGLHISLGGNTIATLTGVAQELEMEESFVLINRSIGIDETGTAADDLLIGDADDRCIFDQAAGDLWYDADGVGGAAQVMVAHFEMAATLGADDFIIV